MSLARLDREDKHATLHHCSRALAGLAVTDGPSQPQPPSQTHPKGQEWVSRLTGYISTQMCCNLGESTFFLLSGATRNAICPKKNNKQTIYVLLDFFKCVSSVSLFHKAEMQ
jgi:hypothetical protein